MDEMGIRRNILLHLHNRDVTKKDEMTSSISEIYRNTRLMRISVERW
jgi:hypothetical protein